MADTPSHENDKKIKALLTPTRRSTSDMPIVKLIDDLFEACRERNLTLELRPDRCEIRTHDGQEIAGANPFPEKIFRPMMSRIGVVLQKNLYGDNGEIAIGNADRDAVSVFTVGFSNTPDKTAQHLSLKPVWIALPLLVPGQRQRGTEAGHGV